MVTGTAFRALALGLPHAAEKPHFDRAAFFIDASKGKIFATMPADGESANLMLDREGQEMLLAAAPAIFSRLPNKWGDRGATMIDLGAADREAALSALRMAWRLSAPETLRGALGGP